MSRGSRGWRRRLSRPGARDGRFRASSPAPGPRVVAAWCVAVPGRSMVPGGLFSVSRVPGQGGRSTGGPAAPPFFAGDARAAGYSMITGCSPRYSRPTTRDHDFGLPGDPRGRGRGDNGKPGRATPVSAEHQGCYSNRNPGQGEGLPGACPGYPDMGRERTADPGRDTPDTVNLITDEDYPPSMTHDHGFPGLGAIPTRVPAPARRYPRNG